MTPYADTLRALFARANQGIKLGLETMQALLAALGEPQRAMRHVVVAGTNGKGSTSTLVALALGAAGHHVGHYTSPHLLRFTERIRIDGREIGRGEVQALYERVLAAEAACPRAATFFELATGMALVAFAERGVELAVLEVGMGGRLDATNAVDKELSVITRVDLDHQRFLGDTIEAIAFEKAGIIADGGTVVVGAQRADALAVVERVAHERAANVVAAPTVAVAGEVLTLAFPSSPLALREWPAGAFQRENLATAAAACRVLAERGIACPDTAIAHAARAFRWPGRYEWVADDLLVDGAHNPVGIRALMAAVADDPRARGRPVHVVATVLGDRPPQDMLPPLAARAASLHLTPVPSSRTRTQEELATLAAGATAHPSLAAALAAARARAEAGGGFVLVCGSLFLAAEALALVRAEERDPPVDA